MRRWAALAVSLLATAAPSAAIADGDPASDVLLGQDVFLPYSPISQRFERELYAATAAARQAGFPLKVALIEGKADLGVVPALFGKPQAYARFLSSELGGFANLPVLVVMPDGFGLARRGAPLPLGALSPITIGPGADGLGAAAVAATEHLAAAAGHPLPSNATSGGLSGASAGTVRHALTAIAVLAAIALLGIGWALIARSRRDRLSAR